MSSFALLPLSKHILTSNYLLTLRPEVGACVHDKSITDRACLQEANARSLHSHTTHTPHEKDPRTYFYILCRVAGWRLHEAQEICVRFKYIINGLQMCVRVCGSGAVLSALVLQVVCSAAAMCFENAERATRTYLTSVPYVGCSFRCVCLLIVSRES